MPNPTPKIFKKSLLAIAVLSLSGCASAPKMDDVDLSPIGEGILTAGRATAEVGIYAWDVSMYLLGFSDEENEQAEGNMAKSPFPMDEIDAALLEDDALLPEDTLTPVKIASAKANADDALRTKNPDELVIFGEPNNTKPSVAKAAEAAPTLPDPLLIQPTLEGGANVDSDKVDIAQSEFLSVEELGNEEAVAKSDTKPEFDGIDGEEYVHIVEDNENLWDIAKATTGDATNWHSLADINDLNQDAGIFAGQALRIPVDMLKPELLDGTSGSSNDNQTASNPIIITPKADSETNQEAVLAATDTNSSGTRFAIPPAPEPVEGTTVKLNSGETLWDFAKRTTGDATNWKAIAGHNNFTEKQAVVVREGQSIVVPDDLVKADVTIASAQPAAKQAISDEARAEVMAAIDRANASANPSANASANLSAKTSADESAINASAELLTEASLLSNVEKLSDETQPITIVEANFQADPSEQPIKIPSDALEIVKLTPQSADLNQVMVSGTYYPKAIYNDADFSSSLLMRVSPGTSLKVSNAVGNWFEVETEKGTGYVHQRDIK